MRGSVKTFPTRSVNIKFSAPTSLLRRDALPMVAAAAQRAIPHCGKVEDWRAGVGRSLYSLLPRPFVCECHTISTMPRFQPRHVERSVRISSHCVLLFVSPQGLWDMVRIDQGTL